MLNEYPTDFIETHCKPDKPKQRKKDTGHNQSKRFYFEFPYIDDKTDRRINHIFKHNNLNVRIYRRSHTLRQRFQKQRTAPTCNKNKCPLNNPKLCNRKMCVYNAKCTKCKQTYIGSTIRALHTRASEHDSDHNSSIYKHKSICKSKFEYSIITTATDITKLRFLEAIHIKSNTPQINSKEESNELNHLIF